MRRRERLAQSTVEAVAERDFERARRQTSGLCGIRAYRDELSGKVYASVRTGRIRRCPAEAL